MYGHGFGSSDWLCGPGSFFPGPFGMIITLIFWGVVLVLIFKGVSYLFGKRTASGQVSSGALEILRERYARGEISKTEFDQMKKDVG